MIGFIIMRFHETHNRYPFMKAKANHPSSETSSETHAPANNKGLSVTEKTATTNSA